MEVAINANDEVKVAVVEAGCVEKLTHISSPSLQMKAIDLLILICANDESLKLVSAQQELVTTALGWLKAPTTLPQRANSALLLANMARTDEMCEMFISRGLVSLLLHLTQIEEPEELSGKVLVSALSALRNLCLPVSQKAGLVESGVLDAALRCLRDSKWPHVHFKCLGIARLLAPLKEVCVQLSQPGTVALVCERCSPAEPAQVKIEGSRLLAGLVKYCQSEEVMRVVISEGGVKLIASLLDSAHLSLRNEALLALNLLAVVKDDGEFKTSLTDEVVVGGVWGVVSAGDSSPELVSNALTFLVLLAEKQWTAEVREKLVMLEGLTDKLDSLTQNDSQTVSDLAKQLAKKLSLNPT
ncbi:Rap1 GTPase-GDP dissociation stimulator 1-A [Geodia barretti]|uniref:Rap1 GTPase-GDP dissociation stimulator 1-A n=2 Tax=Geodia barretti TaxID=519541 RepID=A0AA35S7Q7_GEOBA|nr:Rap1 GTPase-GDP dissociation stimulator 1-A [Geodia barretti]